jgi:hypothetical protein
MTPKFFGSNPIKLFTAVIYEFSVRCALTDAGLTGEIAD